MVLLYAGGVKMTKYVSVLLFAPRFTTRYSSFSAMAAQASASAKAWWCLVRS